ncbi:MAG: SPFH domain-containing protein [Phycisphaeraceae bacterium]
MTQQKIKNPFMHTHDHDHDHGHDHHDHHHDDEENLSQLDPAQQSLADALRVSFNILKGLMVLLLIAYLFSGTFWVEEQERAVRLRFGALVGEPGQQVYDPGWHFGFPYPVEQIIRVPVQQQTLEIQRAYWYEVSDEDLGRSAAELAGRSGPLNPERDGSLLTGDANILHARFTVDYTISDPAAFVENVGLARPNVDRLPDGTLARRPMDRADAIVRNVAEQGVIHAFARADADQVYRGTWDDDHALTRMRDVMEQMNTGITINLVNMTDPTLPLVVSTAAQAVTNAESERAQLIEQARQEQARILGETAGAAHGPLFDLILEYEAAREVAEPGPIDTLQRFIDDAIESRQISSELAWGLNAIRRADLPPATRIDLLVAATQFAAAWQAHKDSLDGDDETRTAATAEQLQVAREALHALPGGEQLAQGLSSVQTTLPPAVRVGGEVARLVNEASTYRTTVEQQIQAEVSLFQAYLEEYRRSPRLLQARLWQDAREAILSGDVESFYLMGGQFYPVLNRDPALARQREEERLRQQDEERRERQQQP